MQALQIVEQSTQRVLTTAQLAEAYGTTENTIQVNFSRNKERYVAGKHYFCLEGAELKSFLTTLQNVRSSNSRINKLYLWTEKGALLHAKSLNSDKAWEVYERLVDEYYRLVKAPVAAPTIHTLTDAFRPRALENLHRVPDGYFSVMGELFKHLYNLEALFNRSLDENAMIEISVGLRWTRHAREVLRIPDQHRCKYAHVCQGGRIEQVWAYALQYVTIFDKWLWEVYFPQHFPNYERYRARYIGLPAPKIRKQLPSPMNRTQAVQARFEWE